MSAKKGDGIELCFNRLMLTHCVGVVVLRHLASTQERVRVCRSVSKECREVVDGNVRSLKANLQSFSNPASKLQLNFAKLEVLSFDRISSGTNEMLLQFVQHKPHLLQKLKSLNLSNCIGLEAIALQQLLNACSHLCQLSLPEIASSVNSTRQEFLEVLCNHGAHLTNLEGIGHYICAATVSSVSALSNLQSLNISPGKSNLVQHPSALQLLSSLTNLQQLQLGNSLACYETCALAASLPRLSSLQFTYVDDRSMPPRDLTPLSACRSIVQLSLCSVVCNDELLLVLARCKVSSLTLHSGTFSATPKGAALLQQQLRGLQLQVSDKDISAFAAAVSHLRGLSSLSVTIHRAAEDCSGLLQAIFGLSGIQQLSLASHYNGISEQESQGLPTVPQLTSLSLTNHFSNATLSRILSTVPQLQHLQLASCGAISDAGLSNVVGHCKQLKSVRLELMRGVGVAGVAALAAGPHVSRIVLEGCRNVLAEECREVMRQSDKLDLEVVKLK